MVAEARTWPDIAIPPGHLLAETIDTLGLSQAELARRAGRPAQAINEIIRGIKEITPETALQFERVLGVPAHVWIRLEADYRFNKARLEDRRHLEQEISLATRYPYAEMARWGWVAQTRESLYKASELLKFFGVASLRHVELDQLASFRRSSGLQTSPEALAAWLRQGERQGHTIETAPFKREALLGILSELRSLTRQPPEEFLPRLERILADCGVALVLVPHLRKTGAHGATRWLGQEKALVQMSIRYKWDDVFWFSLFHELGHVILHGRKDIFIERDGGNGDHREKEANTFASEQLISSERLKDFLNQTNRPSRDEVILFAHEIGIAPSIVIGRLQHDGAIPHSHLNHLRSRFEWVSTNREDSMEGPRA